MSELGTFELETQIQDTFNRRCSDFFRYLIIFSHSSVYNVNVIIIPNNIYCVLPEERSTAVAGDTSVVKMLGGKVTYNTVQLVTKAWSG